MRIYLPLLFAFLALFIPVHAGQPETPLQDGDLIFHRSLSELSGAIELATGSPITHMGVIFLRDGQPWVLEAGSVVQYTSLEEFTTRGADSHYVVKRVADADSRLNKKAIAAMRSAGDKFLGRRYDGQFNWSDDRLYCSELAWKVYKAAGIELCPLRKFDEYNFEHPIVKAQLQQRYGNVLPTDEPVVAPSDIFAFASLELVTER